MAEPLTIVPRPFYKPLAIRTPILSIYLIATLGLLALIEYACQKVPNHTGAGSFDNVVNYTEGYFGRRDAAQKDSSAILTHLVLRQTTTAEVTITSTTDIPDTSVTDDSTPGGGTSAPANGFLTVGDGTVSTTTTPQIASSAADGFLSLGNTPTLTESAQNGFLTIGGEETTTTPTPSLTLSASNGFLTIGNDGTPTKTPDASPNTSQDQGTKSGTDQKTTVTPIHTASTSVFTVSATPAGGYLQTGSVTYISIETTLKSIIYSTTTGANGETSYIAVSTSETVAIEVFPTRLPNAPEPTQTVVNSAGTFILMSDGSVERAPQITLRQYVIVAFLPLILAVVFTFPWRILDTTIREMEPFYQLQKPGGAVAGHSILLDYTTSFFITTPFKSIYRGHYYVFSSALISIAVLIIAPLSSEALFVSLSGECGINKTGPCHAAWGVYPKLARAMEAILAFIVLLVCTMMIFNFRRQSGVYANPLNIAGLGTLFQNPAMLTEFAAIDSRVSNSALKKILTGRKYNLSMMKSFDDSSYYGISNLSGNEDGNRLSTFSGDVRGKYSVVNSADQLYVNSEQITPDEYEEKNTRWAWVTERVSHVGAFLLIAGLFTLVTYYHWTGGDTGFERFMDSQRFGVRFLMTIVGVVIKLFWMNIDEELRRTEPYRRLLQGSAKPEDSVLVYTYMSSLSALIPSLYRRHFLISLISLVSLLSEILPIALANIPFSPAATREAYSICTYVAMGILIVMMLSLLLLIFRRSHDLHHLPRQPVMIASILLYIATTPHAFQGSMLESLAGLATVTGKERDQVVRAMGRTYGMGLVGETELRIDQEERIPRL